MTVLETIQRSSEFLARKGVESARLQAELLLAATLNLPRMRLYLEFERELTEAQTNQMREWVLRRSRREPLQQIVGSVSFCGIELAVTPDVLVPRPETEILAEQAWTFLLARTAEAPLAIDIGTGSGCLAIALSQRAPAAHVIAVDQSAAAIKLAQANAVRAGVDTRTRFFQGDAFTALPAATRADLVLSNPPYIPTAEIDTLQPEVRDHEPRAALDGGVDGLDFYRMFATTAQDFLQPGGKLMVECGDGQAEQVSALLTEQNWIVEAIVQDYNQNPRIVIARRD